MKKEVSPLILKASPKRACFLKSEVSPFALSAGAAKSSPLKSEVPPFVLSAGAAKSSPLKSEVPPFALSAGAAKSSPLKSEVPPSVLSAGATKCSPLKSEVPPFALSAGAAKCCSLKSEVPPFVLSAGAEKSCHLKKVQPQTIWIDGIVVLFVKKRMRSMRISISPPEGAVRVSVPTKTTEAEVSAFLTAKLGWIKKHLAKYEGQLKPSERQFASGEQLPIFGTMYPVEGSKNRKLGTYFDGNTIFIYSAEGSDCAMRAAQYAGLLKKLLVAELAVRVPYWEGVVGLKCAGTATRAMRTCWGTCNIKTHKLCFAVRLAEKPLQCLDYVIVHELGHILVPNHGEKFKNYMSQKYPQWKAVRKLLNKTTI